MASLGSFGTVREEVEPDTFDYFGTTVRANPAMSDLDMADFMEVAVGIDLDNPKQAIRAVAQVKKLLRAHIHPDDFAGFWKTARANRQSLTDLMQIIAAVAEAAAGRPTGRPSASTDGPQPTPGSSPTVRDIFGPELARHHPGRPDLQLAALRTIEGRVASAG